MSRQYTLSPQTSNQHLEQCFLLVSHPLDKKVGTSYPELSTKQKILPLNTNHGGTSGRSLARHNSTNTQIRALYQPLILIRKK